MVIKKEIKLKAVVEDVAAVRARVKQVARYVGKETEVDFFYTHPSLGGSELRVRKYGKRKEITLKILVNEKVVQENEEYKFTIDNWDSFLKLIELLGCRLIASVRKDCEVFQAGKIAVRISRVEGIGTYVELTAGGEEGKDVKKEDLLRNLKKLGVSEEMIDNRYYGKIKEDAERVVEGVR